MNSNGWCWSLRLAHDDVNLLKYSSNYSDKKGSLWCYSNDEGTDLNNDNETLGHKVAQPNPNQVNVIIKNAALAVPLKYLSNFWISFKIPLINCKVETKLKWTKALCFIYA